MKIAYLTNQYPHVRHTFIRREIVGLEAHGVAVKRATRALADERFVEDLIAFADPDGNRISVVS